MFDGAGGAWYFRAIAGCARDTGRVRRATLMISLAIPTYNEAAVIEETLRSRLEAQHGWQFEHAWPDASERESIRRASAALRESAGLTSTAEG